MLLSTRNNPSAFIMHKNGNSCPIKRGKRHSEEEKVMPEIEGGTSTGANGEGTQDKTPNTFTQEQVDSMIAARLRREQEKYSDYEDLKVKAQKYDESQDKRDDYTKLSEQFNTLQAELAARDEADKVRGIREKVAKEKKVPVELLTATTEDDCAAQADSILAFAKPTGDYPEVKDGGESRGTGKGSTGEQFAMWASNLI